jgi:hypothetical protein
MKLLNEVFKSVKKKSNNKKKQTKKTKTKTKPARWSLSLTWLVGFKPAIDRVLLLTNQIYHS